ncbi:hypothetical protein FV139_05940 [Parahaliea maris]|uniref:TonB C-terminal domain-containing protein n=1 Tax=Parahaliea maris TaxID=2716870 RepID=A0A5C9A3X9_9GAMM|nr:hypothetical protein [Parahaliea maris]TXS95426.1 hypothetical protein FV139_05940 [Parahaliea maris]
MPALACLSALAGAAPEGQNRWTEDAVRRAEHARGAYAPDLIEPLSDSARFHSEAGKHSDAISDYQRALHLTRINGGLYNAGQIPLLQQLAVSQESLGQLLEADSTRDYLYRVQRNVLSADPAESARAALVRARWKRNLYRAGVGHEPYLWLLQSHRAHAEALELLGPDNPDFSARLEHVYGRMETEYLISHYRNPQQRGLSFSSPGFAGRVSLDADAFRLLKKHNYRNGRKTLQQAIDLLQSIDPLPLEELARVHIALGDWHLWWFQHSSAQHSYRDAWRLWEGERGAGTAASALFPEPRLLPDGQKLGSGSVGGEAGAHVRFRVSKKGEARDIEVLELAAPPGRDSDFARVVVFNLLKEYRFRPVVRAGEVVTGEPVERRFRFDY